MPPDYGFALLDREGKVLFHSTSALSGRGNFLDDLDDPRDLRAAMLSGQELNFWARYQGLGMRVHSTPLTGIAGSSWTLVVFHELFQNEAQNAERIALFAVLALAYFVIVCIMVLSIPIESVTPTWIWPSDERKGAYLHLILAVLLIVPAFYFLIFELEEVTPILIAAFVIPLLTLAAAIFKLKNRKGLILAVSTMPVLAGLLGSIVVPSRSALLLLFLISAALSFVSVTEVETWLGKLRRPSTSSSFALLSALLLMISGILPCTAFFKVAYDYQASLLTRRWQMQTIEALATREARVKDQYRMIPLTSNDASGPDETSRWLFLRRRLEETTDRYDTVPFNLQGRSLSESSFTNIVGTCEIDLPPRLLTAIAGRIPYGKGTLTHSFSQISNSADGKWRWCRESDRRIRLAPGAQSRNDDDPYYNLPATRAFIKAATGDSVFLYPTVISEWPRLGPWSMLAAATAFLAAWWLAYVWIKPTLQLMFRKDPPADPLPELSLDRNTTFDNDMILLAADPREASAYFRKRLGTHVVDFADVLRGTPVDYRSITMPHVVIDHFDHQLGSAKADASRLEVLEGLLFADPARRLLLLSSTDPKFFFKESNADAAIAPEDALRWSRCLHNFKTVQLARHDQPRDGEYRLIWQASTASEKAALYQLARDGLANPQNTDALRHLQLRGLIAGWPLEIRDAHFADYVKRVAGYAERKSWQKQDSSGIWEGIRLTVVVVLLGMLAAVLFFNQQTYLSYIVTGLSVLTPLSKLLTEVKTLPLLLGFGGKKE
jgi:hypothetical protein